MTRQRISPSQDSEAAELFTQEIHAAMKEMSGALQGLVKELHITALTQNTMRGELNSLADAVIRFTKIVEGEGSAGSLLTRLALIERDIKSNKERLDAIPDTKDTIESAKKSRAWIIAHENREKEDLREKVRLRWTIGAAGGTGVAALISQVINWLSRM